jgi:hypothetical protein
MKPRVLRRTSTFFSVAFFGPEEQPDEIGRGWADFMPVREVEAPQTICELPDQDVELLAWGNALDLD